MTIQPRRRSDWLSVFLGSVAALGVANMVGLSSAKADPLKIGMRADYDGEPDRPANAVSPADGPSKTGVAAGEANAQTHTGRGNPLWAIPLNSLSATRERPIFSASRRSPLVIAPAPTMPQPMPVVGRSTRPQVTLVGAISSDTEGLAILLDDVTKAPIRLKTGEEYDGWTLTQVQGREATMQRDEDTVTLELPGPPPASNK